MFSPRAEEYPFQTCSLCIFLKCITTLVSFYLLFPLLYHSFSTSSSLFLWKESHFCIQVTVQTLYIFTVVQLRSENWEAEARATDMGKTQILPTAASVLERTCHHVSLTSSRKNGIWFHINSISVNSISLNRVTLISSEQTIRMTDSSLRIAKDKLCVSEKQWFWSLKTTDEWFKWLMASSLMVWG